MQTRQISMPTMTNLFQPLVSILLSPLRGVHSLLNRAYTPFGVAHINVLLALVLSVITTILLTIWFWFGARESLLWWLPACLGAVFLNFLVVVPVVSLLTMTGARVLVFLIARWQSPVQRAQRLIDLKKAELADDCDDIAFASGLLTGPWIILCYWCRWNGRESSGCDTLTDRRDSYEELRSMLKLEKPGETALLTARRVDGKWTLTERKDEGSEPNSLAKSFAHLRFGNTADRLDQRDWKTFLPIADALTRQTCTNCQGITLTSGARHRFAITKLTSVKSSSARLDSKIAVSPDGTRLALLHLGRIQIFDLGESASHSHNQMRTMPSRSAALPGSTMQFSPHGEKLAYNDDRATVVWDTQTLKRLLEVPIRDSRLTSFAWLPDGRLLSILKGRPAQLGIYDFNSQTWEIVSSCGANLKPVGERVDLSPDGKIVAISSWGYAKTPVTFVTCQRLQLLNLEHRDNSEIVDMSQLEQDSNVRGSEFLGFDSSNRLIFSRVCNHGATVFSRKIEDTSEVPIATFPMLAPNNRRYQIDHRGNVFCAQISIQTRSTFERETHLELVSGQSQDDDQKFLLNQDISSGEGDYGPGLADFALFPNGAGFAAVIQKGANADVWIAG